MTAAFTDYDFEKEKILRRRKVSEAMLAESQQPMGGTEMVSGIAVRRSPFEGISKVAKAYMAQKGMADADDEAKSLVQRQRDEIAAAMGDYQKATTPRAAVPGALQEDAGGNSWNSDAQPAFTPDANAKRSAAMGLMGRIGDPRDAAKMMVAEALKTPEIKAYKPGDVLYRDGAQVGSIPAAPKFHSVGGNLVPEPVAGAAAGAQVAPVYTAPETKPTDVREYEYAKAQGYTGSFAQFQQQQRKAGATSVTVSAGTEKKYGEQFAGAVAKQDVDLLDAARKAPELATRANQVKEILASGKVITGAGADVRLQLGKALNLAGASDAETISNTEALSVNLARNTLDAIKASGLGSGNGFSNADRDFLEKAAGGKINLEGATIGRLADLSHRAADQSAMAWNKRVKDSPDSALGGTGIKRDPIAVTPLYGTKGKAQRTVSPTTRSLLDKYAPESR